jgi:hypothetical protein
VELYDAYGIGEGASGAAAGLLHPFTPRGKLLWGGLEGYRATLHLIDVADTARGALLNPNPYGHRHCKPTHGGEKGLEYGLDLQQRRLEMEPRQSVTTAHGAQKHMCARSSPGCPRALQEPNQTRRVGDEADAAATDEPLRWTDGIMRYANGPSQVNDLNTHVGPRGNSAEPDAPASVAAQLRTFTVSGALSTRAPKFMHAAYT